MPADTKTAAKRSLAPRLLRPGIGLALVLALTGWLAGCVSTITPPADPLDPITIFLVQEASHVGLVFPGADGAMTEYGFGDWDWYATMHDQWYHAFDTVLWSTRGTLGFRRFGSEARFLANHPAKQRSPIRVPRVLAHLLVTSFAAEIARGESERLYNPTYDMTFVPAADGYWFGYNCYDAVSRWLRALDCHVSWVPVRLGLSVRAEPSPEEERS
jgi:hypothetical protein